MSTHIDYKRLILFELLGAPIWGEGLRDLVHKHYREAAIELAIGLPLALLGLGFSIRESTGTPLPSVSAPIRTVLKSLVVILALPGYGILLYSILAALRISAGEESSVGYRSCGGCVISCVASDIIGAYEDPNRPVPRAQAAKADFPEEVWIYGRSNKATPYLSIFAHDPSSAKNDWKVIHQQKTGPNWDARVNLSKSETLNPTVELYTCAEVDGAEWKEGVWAEDPPGAQEYGSFLILNRRSPERRKR